MDLRIACNTNAEEVSIVLSNELNQVHCVVKTIFLVHPISSSSGRVSSKGKQIADAVSLSLIETLNNLLFGHICTRHMHQHVNFHILLNV